MPRIVTRLRRRVHPVLEPWRHCMKYRTDARSSMSPPRLAQYRRHNLGEQCIEHHGGGRLVQTLALGEQGSVQPQRGRISSTRDRTRTGTRVMSNWTERAKITRVGPVVYAAVL